MFVGMLIFIAIILSIGFLGSGGKDGQGVNKKFGHFRN